MICPKCGAADLPDDDEYCPKCGNNLSGHDVPKPISYDKYIYEVLEDCEEYLHSIRFWVRLWSILACIGIGLTALVYFMGLLAMR